MRFDALELSLDTIQSLRPVHHAIRSRDPALAKQLRDAASSVALNVSEGSRRSGRDKLHLWSVAAGSAEEVRTALRVAGAWGYLNEARARDTLALVDRLQAILWKLTH